MTHMKAKYAAIGVLLVIPLALYADDWPQWRGPDRTGVSREKGLLKKWPDKGPSLKWTYKEAGNGYSAPAIVGDVVYTMGARKGDDYLIALDVKNGNELWAKKIGPSYEKTQWSDGPNSTPTVDKDLIFALSSNGELACFDTNGNAKWSVDLQKKMKARVNPIFAKEDSQGWGFAWSPLVDGDNLIITPGGPNGLFAALNKKSGEVVWQSKDVTEPCTYASPIVAEVHGVRQYIAIVQDGGVGVDAKAGAPLWRFKRRPPYSDVVCSTPIHKDNLVFLTAIGGCDLVELTKDGDKFTAKKKVTTKDFQNMHGGVVLVDKHLYGAHEHRNWQCLEFTNPANVAWESDKDNDVRPGSLTYADGMLYVYSEKDGTVALLKATPDKYTEISKFMIPQKSKLRPQSGGFWTHPVVANGRLYLRDQELIFCYEVK
jgi:outer membrane protein assembly factor BamB